MYPLPFQDLIEIREEAHGKDPLSYSESGTKSGAKPEENLCFRAWDLFRRHCYLPPLSIHLHKQIPVGAGLGGGSSDASTVLKGLNRIAPDRLSPAELNQLAASLGSDCPFFLENGPRIMRGRGEILEPFREILKGAYLVLLSPDIHVSTANAYAGVRPARPERDLTELLEEPCEEWQGLVRNDFEPSVFKQHPRIGELKAALMKSGAWYASMSGSGSALYGLYEKDPDLGPDLLQSVKWKGWL